MKSRKVMIMGTEYTIQKKAYEDDEVFGKKCIDG